MDDKLTRAAALVRQAQSLSKKSVQHALEMDQLASRIESVGQASKKNSLAGRISPELYRHTDEHRGARK